LSSHRATNARSRTAVPQKIRAKRGANRSATRELQAGRQFMPEVPLSGSDRGNCRFSTQRRHVPERDGQAPIRKVNQRYRLSHQMHLLSRGCDEERFDTESTAGMRGLSCEEIETVRAPGRLSLVKRLVPLIWSVITFSAVARALLLTLPQISPN